jgi:hypothetical protein
MLCFITAETTAASWISDFFRGFGMPLATEKIDMVKGVKCIACEKSQGNNTKPKYGPAKIMVMDIGDIFDFSACFLKDGVINDKTQIFLRKAMKIEPVKNFMINTVHKCSPPVTGILFEPVIGVLSTSRPLLPLFSAERIDGLELQ